MGGETRYRASAVFGTHLGVPPHGVLTFPVDRAEDDLVARGHGRKRRGVCAVHHDRDLARLDGRAAR